MNELSISPEDLPGVASRIARSIGVERTLALVQKLSGSRVFVPADPQAGHRLVETLGLDAARALSALFPGERLELPSRSSMLRVLRDAEVRSLHGSMSTSAIAERFGISQRLVRYIVTRER
jgi:hypothetical protein